MRAGPDRIAGLRIESGHISARSAGRLKAQPNPRSTGIQLIRGIRGGFIGHEFHRAAQPQPKTSREDASWERTLPACSVNRETVSTLEACAPRGNYG